MRWSVQLSGPAADALATMDPSERNAAFLVIGRLTQGPTPEDGPRPRPYKAFPGDLLLAINDRLSVGYRAPAEYQILIVGFVLRWRRKAVAVATDVNALDTGVAA